MKVLITGGDGQLAKSIIEAYSNNGLIVTTKKDLDVTNRIKAIRKISDINPDIIFHFASMTRGDECAKNPTKANLINIEGTRNVVEACKKNKCALLFVSTNEVFDGKKKTAYTEKDEPNPITTAGKTKYEAEKIITANLEKYFIIRSSWLYSKWSNNFLNKVLDIAEKYKKLAVVDDEISSPTYSVDLAKAIKQLIKTNKYGIYHLSNTGKASRFDFALKSLKFSKISPYDISRIKLKDFPRLSKPPLFTPLNNSKAKRIGIKMASWESALKRYLISNKLLK